jgi:hypothetical protein
MVTQHGAIRKRRAGSTISLKHARNPKGAFFRPSVFSNADDMAASCPNWIPFGCRSRKVCDGWFKPS